MFRLIILFSIITLTGCATTAPTINTSTEVIEKKLTCFPVIEKPILQKINVKVQQLITGKYAITLTDKEFDKLLINQLNIDNYIKKTYTIQNRYQQQCK